jgi:hypothetical protein
MAGPGGAKDSGGLATEQAPSSWASIC